MIVYTSTYRESQSVRPTPAAASRVLTGQDESMIDLDDPCHTRAHASSSASGPQRTGHSTVISVLQSLCRGYGMCVIDPCSYSNSRPMFSNYT